MEVLRILGNETDSTNDEYKLASGMGVVFNVCGMLFTAGVMIRSWLQRQQERGTLDLPAGGLCKNPERQIRFLVGLFFVLDISHFVVGLTGIDDMKNLLTVSCYCAHILAQGAIYSAFWVFVLMWVDILNSAATIRRLANFTAATMVTILSILSLTAIVECYIDAGQYLDPSTNSQPLFYKVATYKILMVFSSVSLLFVSTIFLCYGVYLARRLQGIFSNTLWQRQLLRKLNLVLVVCTVSCFLRAVLLLLLFLEEYNLIDDHYFSGSDSSGHPLVWLLLSQIIPNLGLSSVFLYMTQPRENNQGSTVTAQHLMPSVVEDGFTPPFNPYYEDNYNPIGSPESDASSGQYFLGSSDQLAWAGPGGSFRGGRGVKVSSETSETEGRIMANSNFGRRNYNGGSQSRRGSSRLASGFYGNEAEPSPQLPSYSPVVHPVRSFNTPPTLAPQGQQERARSHSSEGLTRGSAGESDVGTGVASRLKSSLPQRDRRDFPSQSRRKPGFDTGGEGGLYGVSDSFNSVSHLDGLSDDESNWRS